MLPLASLLLAAAGKAAEKGKAAEPEGIFKYLDAANDFIKGLNFEREIHDPKFWAISIVVLGVSLFRGWKTMMIGYIGVVALWGVVHYTVLKDTAGAGQASGNVLVFAGLTVGVAGLGIYFLLIRD